jgi:hypothetical protein
LMAMKFPCKADNIRRYAAPLLLIREQLISPGGSDRGRPRDNVRPPFVVPYTLCPREPDFVKRYKIKKTSDGDTADGDSKIAVLSPSECVFEKVPTRVGEKCNPRTAPTRPQASIRGHARAVTEPKRSASVKRGARVIYVRGECIHVTGFTPFLLLRGVGIYDATDGLIY